MLFSDSVANKNSTKYVITVNAILAAGDGEDEGTDF